MIHDLKTWPAHFQRIWDGEKPFELRRNDRGFQVGDALRLREWTPNVLLGASLPGGVYSGRVIEVPVTYVMTDPVPGGFRLGGWVVLGLAMERRNLIDIDGTPS